MIYQRVADLPIFDSKTDRVGKSMTYKFIKQNVKNEVIDFK